MATALPSTGAPAPSTGAPAPKATYSCDTSDLLMIHRFLRTMFDDAVTLVESVTPGDTVRSAAVADFISENAAVLHGHHHGEDELLWSLMEQRTPACSLHVEKMKI